MVTDNGCPAIHIDFSVTGFSLKTGLDLQGNCTPSGKLLCFLPASFSSQTEYYTVMAVLVLIFTAASVYIFSILAIMLQRSEPLLMSSVTDGTRVLLINFLPFALMTIILAVTDCSICYVADAVLSLAYLRFTTEGFFDLIFLAASAGTLALNIIAAMIHVSAICIACEYIFSEKKESPEEEEMTMEIK